MTVHQLICRLMQFPPNTLVVVNMGCSELANGKEVSSVELEDAHKWDSRDLAWVPDYSPWYNDSDEDHEEIKCKLVNISSLKY